jgi:PAS domain-containing protein
VVPALSELFARVHPAILAAGVLVALGLLAALTLEWRGRRRAELAARTAAGQLRTVTASMREGVIAYGMDLQLSFVNPAFERLTGFVAEDLRDQEFLQHVHPDDRPALLAEWERLTGGGSLRDQE